MVQPVSGTPERPVFAPEQELRFAVVMYGGVSLAVYINGVARELFSLVRATAPEVPFTQDADQRVYFADAGPQDNDGAGRRRLTAVEGVYRELAQCLGIDGPREAAETEPQPRPVRTRFVVDILSGTSAGGINGIYLAKA